MGDKASRSTKELDWVSPYIESPSTLLPNAKGLVSVRILQAKGGRPLVGSRLAREGAEGPRRPTRKQIDTCDKILSRTQEGCLNVVSHHRGITGCLQTLRNLSKTRTIVAMGGIAKDERKIRRNYTYIASGGDIRKQTKLSLSTEDISAKVRAGRKLLKFTRTGRQKAVSWAVLNCHDYTDVRLLLPLLDMKVELLVVVTHNPATRLYWEYAISDIHRLFCYVVIVNIAEIGGSAVFGPFRRIGFERNAELGTAGQIFGSRGPCEFEATCNLDISELRRLRNEFSAHGFGAAYKASSKKRPNTSVIPSEHFMQTHDRSSGVPPVAKITNIRTNWPRGSIRVAVGQLQSMPLATYHRTKYRIRNDPACRQFERDLDSRLLDLESRYRLSESSPERPLLDLLVFPEVFVPRTYARTRLQGLSDRWGTTIICGVDYPDGAVAQNANQCMIIRPKQPPITYQKVTRSQYDAVVNKKGKRMALPRGKELFRFVNKDGRGFGVLVCYDFSHLDLVAKINMYQRREPLDVLVVVAHNPFGNLYRSCCLADAHRFYQYVVMCNVAEYGGSGIFGPTRESGNRQALLDIGKGAEGFAVALVDLKGLRAARAAPDRNLHNGDFMRRPGIFQKRT